MRDQTPLDLSAFEQISPTDVADDDAGWRRLMDALDVEQEERLRNERDWIVIAIASFFIAVAIVGIWFELLRFLYTATLLVTALIMLATITPSVLRRR